MLVLTLSDDPVRETCWYSSISCVWPNKLVWACAHMNMHSHNVTHLLLRSDKADFVFSPCFPFQINKFIHLDVCFHVSVWFNINLVGLPIRNTCILIKIRRLAITNYLESLTCNYISTINQATPYPIGMSSLCRLKEITRTEIYSC